MEIIKSNIKRFQQKLIQGKRKDKLVLFGKIDFAIMTLHHKKTILTTYCNWRVIY